MNQQAIDNRAWLNALLEKRGLKVRLIDKAAYIASALVPSAAPRFVRYASAYSDGHNNRNLRGRPLDHYARAYADMCEQANLVIDFASFFVAWAEATSGGASCERWYFA